MVFGLEPYEKRILRIVDLLHKDPVDYVQYGIGYEGHQVFCTVVLESKSRIDLVVPREDIELIADTQIDYAEAVGSEFFLWIGEKRILCGVLNLTQAGRGKKAP